MSAAPVEGGAGKLRSLMQRASEQRHLLSVRDGVVAVLPLVLIGSLFLLVAQPPVAAWQAALAKSGWDKRLLIPLQCTTELISVFVAFSVAASLARRHEIDSLGAGLLSAAAFLLAVGREQVSLPGAAKPVGVIFARNLGPGGLFVAVILALFSAEVLRFFTARKWTFRLPEGVPPAVARSFASLLPAACVLLCCWLVFHVARLDVFGLVATVIARPLALASDSLPAVMVVVLLDSILWLFGIHAVAVMAVLRPIWLQLVTENMAAAQHGAAILPHVGMLEFYIWFVWLGGSGGSLCLPFLFWRARSAALRSVARVAALPAVCNINEPIIFGTPIVLNPTLAVPFIAGPLVAAVISWLAFHFNLLTRPHVMVPWTLPAPVGAWLTTGGDWRAVVLMLINLTLITALYWPFVRSYDRQLAARERP